jgi:hypothetical protein
MVAGPGVTQGDAVLGSVKAIRLFVGDSGGRSLSPLFRLAGMLRYAPGVLNKASASSLDFPAVRGLTCVSNNRLRLSFTLCDFLRDAEAEPNFPPDVKEVENTGFFRVEGRG